MVPILISQEAEKGPQEEAKARWSPKGHTQVSESFNSLPFLLFTRYLPKDSEISVRMEDAWAMISEPMFLGFSSYHPSHLTF